MTAIRGGYTCASSFCRECAGLWWDLRLSGRDTAVSGVCQPASAPGDAEPAAREVVRERDAEEDEEPEDAAGEGDRHHPRGPAHVHEEEDDERRLHRRDP